MAWGRRGRQGKRSRLGVSERNTHPRCTERPLAFTGQDHCDSTESRRGLEVLTTKSARPAEPGCPCSHGLRQRPQLAQRTHCSTTQHKILTPDCTGYSYKSKWVSARSFHLYLALLNFWSPLCSPFLWPLVAPQ